MQISPTPFRAAVAIGIGAVAFIAGFSISSAIAVPPPQQPIVDVRAWDQQPPQPVQLVSSRPVATCNPWDVSEAAMEEVLAEMQRRGWRPPNQGDAMTVAGVYAVDPYAPMPTGGGGGGFITVLSDEQAARVNAGDVTVEEIVDIAQSDDLPPPS